MASSSWAPRFPNFQIQQHYLDLDDEKGTYRTTSGCEGVQCAQPINIAVQPASRSKSPPPMEEPLG